MPIGAVLIAVVVISLAGTRTVFTVVEARFAARPMMPLRLFGVRAVLATTASAATETGGSSLAAGYDLVFLIAAGLGLAIALVSVLLPRPTSPRS